MKLADYLRSLGIGAVAGLRTFTAPAAVNASAQSVWTGLTCLAAAGEYVADKLPATPSRLAPPGLIARLVSGGWSGGELAARAGGKRIEGAATGAIGAVAGAWAGHTIRTYLTAERGLPDFLCAIVEDAAAILGARAATST